LRFIRRLTRDESGGDHSYDEFAGGCHRAGWRAAGLQVAPAKDATGADRIPVIDSNWVVVSQSPEAGSVVDQGSFITATVKKETDD